MGKVQIPKQKLSLFFPIKHQAFNRGKKIDNFSVFMTSENEIHPRSLNILCEIKYPSENLWFLNTVLTISP